MSRKIAKEDYLIDDERIDAELLVEEEELEEVAKVSPKEEKKQEKKVQIAYLEKQILKILRKGTVNSKMNLIHLLIKSGTKNFDYKFNLFENKLNYDIPELGGALKKLRFEKEIMFTISEGCHVYYLDTPGKELKSKEPKLDFNWKSYTIPSGPHEIYVAFKIPGSNYKPYHFLSSLFPKARILYYNVEVDKKFEKNKHFILKRGNLEGYFDEDKLILRSNTSNQDITKTLFVIYQVGRYIVKELLSLNRRFAEVIQIHNIEDGYFIPMVPIFRGKERNAFYETKYTNALRSMFDFPKEFEKKSVFGRFSALSKEMDDEKFDLKEFYDFIEDAFKFEVKAFITNAIMNDWIINPNKALNYMEEDEELKNLIEEYLTEIDTDRIIREKLDVSMEKSEFIKDITTNLLLTLLGLSILTDYPPFQWTIIGFFVVINAYYLFIKSRKKKKFIAQ